MDRLTRIRHAFAIREKQKRIAKRAKQATWISLLLTSLFPAQKEFVEAQEQRVCGLCTRRAGKTHGAGAKLLLAAHNKPGSTALYLALTRKSAKRLLWPKIKQMKSQYNIPLKINESDLTAELPNGSFIMLYGADQENLAERLRGDAYSIVVIDEAASFGEHLNYLIDDVLLPALMDYEGQLCMIGTPGPIPFGPFYEATTDVELGWNTHKWSVYDNPHLPHAKAWVADLKKAKKWSDDNPTYLREYCGVWACDPDSLIYKYVKGYNDYDLLPTGIDFDYVLGVDLGYDDHSAWSVWAFNQDHPTAYCVHAEQHTQWIPSQWAEKTKELQEKYNPINTVIDGGGLGKAIILEMQTRWGVPCNFAEKTEKMSNIELMNGDFQAGNLMIHSSCSEYVNQLMTLDKDKTGKKENPAIPNHLCIAKGTKITTKYGLINIEDIVPGVEVLTRQGFKKVLRKFNNGVKEIITIYTDKSELSLTGEHLIMTPSGWKKAKSLNKGDHIICQNQTVSNMTLNYGLESCQIRDITKGRCIRTASHTSKANITNLYSVQDHVQEPTIISKEQVYDLEIEDCHEYFSNGILTHNCDSGLYSYRECRQYMFRPEQAKPKYGTEEYWKEQEKKMLQSAIESEINNQHQGDLYGMESTSNF